MFLFFPTCLRTFPSYLVWGHSLPDPSHLYLIWGPLLSLLELRSSTFPTWFVDPSHLYLMWGPLSFLLIWGTIPFLPFFYPFHPYLFRNPSFPYLVWGPLNPYLFWVTTLLFPFLDQVWEPYLIWGPLHSYLICGPLQSLPVSKIPIYFLLLPSLPVWGQVMTCPPL